MADVASSQGTVTIRCRLVGELRRFLKDGTNGEGPVQLSAPATVDDLLVRLDLPERNLLIVGVNGTKTPHSTPISDGDEIIIVAPMTGGAD